MRELYEMAVDDLRQTLAQAADEYCRAEEAALREVAAAVEHWLADVWRRMPFNEWRQEWNALVDDFQARGINLIEPSTTDIGRLLETWNQWHLDRQERAAAEKINQQVAPSTAPTPQIRKLPPDPYWPWLTDEDRTNELASMGMAWWWPVQVTNGPADGVWEQKLARAGIDARAKLAKVFQELQAEGVLFHQLEKTEDEGPIIDQLDAGAGRIQQAYDDYLRSQIEIRQTFTRYCQSGYWVIGVFVQAQLQRLMADLPARISGLSSPLEAQLTTATLEMNRAYAAAERRHSATATTFTWIDRTVTTIEWLTIIGGIRTGVRKAFEKASLEAAQKAAAQQLGKEAAKASAEAAGKRAVRIFLATQVGLTAANIGVSLVIPRVIDSLGLDHNAVAAGLLALQLLGTLKAYRRPAPSISKRPDPPGLKKPPLPQAIADAKGRRRFNPNIPAHVNAATAEKELAEVVHSLPDQMVIRWGDPIGIHGNDTISVNIRNGDITLWDVKFRSRRSRIKPSPTFNTTPSKRQNAISEAIDTLKNDTTLPASVRDTAIDNLTEKRFRT